MPNARIGQIALGERIEQTELIERIGPAGRPERRPRNGLRQPTRLIGRPRQIGRKKIKRRGGGNYLIAGTFVATRAGLRAMMPSRRSRSCSKLASIGP
jgi:hypothetical protein